MRQNKSKLKIILSFILLIALIFGYILIKNEGPTLYGPYDVVRVVDGDTIVLKIDSKNVKVRLLGINAPESVHDDESKNTAEGKEASDLLKSLITDKVYIEYDEEEFDQYGRTLAYVYLDDQETMLEELMLNLGYSEAVYFEPNGKYYSYFVQLENKAKENNVGLWKTGFYN